MYVQPLHFSVLHISTKIGICSLAVVCEAHWLLCPILPHCSYPHRFELCLRLILTLPNKDGRNSSVQTNHPQ